MEYVEEEGKMNYNEPTKQDHTKALKRRVDRIMKHIEKVRRHKRDSNFLLSHERRRSELLKSELCMPCS